MAHGSKRHRHEEAIDARLTIAPRAVCARRSIFIPIENPVITVPARERQGDRDRTMIPVYTVVVGVPVDLVGRQVMRPLDRSTKLSPNRGLGRRLSIGRERMPGPRPTLRGSQSNPSCRFPRYALSNLTPTDAFALIENRNLRVSLSLAPTIVSPPLTHIAHPALIGKPSQGVDADCFSRPEFAQDAAGGTAFAPS
jgi:hypothetical protein